MEFRGFDVVVELGASSVEYRGLTPTVLGISVELYDSTPAAIGLGIGVERGNDGLDSVVKLWGITPMFMSGFSCVGIPAPRGVGEFGGVMLGRSSVDPAPGVSTDPKRRFLGAVALRDRGRTAVGSYTPAQGDRRGLPRPRQIPSPPGDP